MTGTSPLVSIIILCYNGSPHLKTCLDSIERLTYKNVEVILVDNASTDNSVNIVKSGYPWVKLILNDRNLGYTDGNNVGVSAASGKYIVLLNQDTEIDSRCLDNLVDVIERDKNIGICGCKILLYYNRRYFHHAGGEYNLIGMTLDRGRYELDVGQYNKIEDVTFVNGAAILIRRELIQRIGLFDSKFFAYNEDVDLCLRAWKCGYSVVYVPNAIVYHKLGASFGRLSPIAIFHANKNNLTILLKNIEFHDMLLFLPLALAYRMTLLIMYLRRHELMKAKAIVSSSLWTIKNISYILRERNAMKHLKAEPDLEIINKKLRVLHWRDYQRLAQDLFSFDEAKS